MYLHELPIGVNLRVYFLVGVNQRQMRLAEYACGILHDLSGFQPRFSSVRASFARDISRTVASKTRSDKKTSAKLTHKGMSEYAKSTV